MHNKGNCQQNEKTTQWENISANTSVKGVIYKTIKNKTQHQKIHLKMSKGHE